MVPHFGAPMMKKVGRGMRCRTFIRARSGGAPRLTAAEAATEVEAEAEAEGGDEPSWRHLLGRVCGA